MNPATVKALSPVLMLIGMVMILGGTGLALCFGYVAYEVLYEPQKIKIVGFLLENIAEASNTPSVTGNVDGHPVTYNISTPMKAFGLCYLFIMGFSVLISTARCMSDIGVHIIKVIWPASPAPKKPAPRPDATKPPVPPASPPQTV